MVLMHAEDIEIGNKCVAEYERLAKECEEKGNPFGDGFKKNAAMGVKH